MDVQDRLKEFFSTQSSIPLAILYGSFARGRETKKSDVDIAIAGYENYSSETLADLNLSLAEMVNREIDIVDLNSLGGTILTQILTKGLILKKEDTVLYAGFIKRMLYFEEDMAPNIRYILDYRRERFLYAR